MLLFRNILNFYSWFIYKTKTVFSKSIIIVFLLIFIIHLFLPIIISDFGRSIDFKFEDLHVKIRSKFTKATDNIVIIGIDTETLEYVKERWPWGRDKFAKLIDIISDSKPKAIVLDILFQHSDDKNPIADQLFADAIASAGNVYLVSIIDTQQRYASFTKVHYRSIDKFRNKAKDEGFVWSLVDQDGITRKFKIYDTELNKYSCIYKIFVNEFNNKKGINTYSDTCLLNFPSSNTPIKIINAKSLFEGNCNKEMLTNKVVFIGVTAPILHDYHATPLGILPGVYILACTLESLKNNTHSFYISNYAINILTLAIGILFGVVAIPYYEKCKSCYLIAYPIIYVILWNILIVKFKILIRIFPGLYGYVLFVITCYILIRFYKFLDYQALFVEASAVGEMQKILLPSNCNLLENYKVDIYFKPCAFAAGDFYEIVNINNKQSLIIIFDVAGHGISAAMVTPALKAITYNVISDPEFHIKEDSLFNLMKNYNDTLLYMFKRKMVTAVCCLIDYSSDSIKILSLGHIPQHVYRYSSDSVEELASPSYPLGVKKKIAYNELIIKIEQKDFIVLNTDGVIEALDWNGKILGYLKWKEIIKGGKNKDNIIEYLVDGINSHVNGRPFEDDVSIIVIRK